MHVHPRVDLRVRAHQSGGWGGGGGIDGVVVSDRGIGDFGAVGAAELIVA